MSRDQFPSDPLGSPENSGAADQRPERAALIGALLQEMRRMSALSVLVSQTVADRLGMSPSDLESLDLLNLEGPLTAGQLGELIGLTSGAVTGLVDRWEKAGYVRREPDPHDRRRVIIRPLPTPPWAERIAGPIYESLTRAMTEEVLTRYSDQDLALILDFATRAQAASQEVIAEARGRPVVGEQGQGGEFAAPLAGATSGRLVLESGASQITIQADPLLPDLYRARFEGGVPNVRVRDGTVTVQYRRFSLFKGGGTRGRHP